MPRLTEEERKQRRRKLQQEALDSVAARGQFNFRLDSTDIRRLYQLAGSWQKPVSAMVREWVLERLAKEESGEAPPAPLWASTIEQEMKHLEVLMAYLVQHSLATHNKIAAMKWSEHVKAHFNTASEKQLLDLLSTK